MRILMNQIYQVKKIKKDLRKFEDDLEKRREYRANKKEARMPRLGFLKYQKPDQELKLSSELKGSLRQLVPEGHVLTDRNDVSRKLDRLFFSVYGNDFFLGHIILTLSPA